MALKVGVDGIINTRYYFGYMEYVTIQFWTFRHQLTKTLAHHRVLAHQQLATSTHLGANVLHLLGLDMIDAHNHAFRELVQIPFEFHEVLLLPFASVELHHFGNMMGLVKDLTTDAVAPKTHQNKKHNKTGS